jgi:putative transport protein
MIEILAANPLLLLFLVAAIGYAFGQIRVGGISFGVAGVLFAGIAFGALDPRLELSADYFSLGLVLFVYTIGLSSGRQFFASFSRKGLAANLLIAGLALLAAALSVIAQVAIGLRPAVTAGLFTGSSTVSAAMAAAIEYLRVVLPEAQDSTFNDPVVGFSIAYPMGVIGLLLTISVVQRLWRIDYAREAETASDDETLQQRLVTQTIAVTRGDLAGATIADLVAREGWKVAFGRVEQAGRLAIVDGATTLAPGDRIVATGTAAEVDRVTSYLGARHPDGLELDRRELDYRRVFVSNPEIVGVALRELRLPQRMGAVLSRVRRGDTEFVPNGATRLELGDRVRVTTRRDEIEVISNYFGDSFRRLSEINILTTTIGLVLGLLLGLITVTLPGGITLKLGAAGGPLVVALILSAVGRTGPLVWTLPYNASLTLRQFGLVLFLAAVGTRAGFDFVDTMARGNGPQILIAAICISIVVTLAGLIVGRTLLKIPMGRLMGILGGVFTQPAMLGFAADQTRDDRSAPAYAAAFPIALILKILIVQVMLALLL